MSRGYDRPRFAIEVIDGAERFPLGREYMSLLDSVALEQVWDGADELRLTFRAMDAQRRLRVVGEKILEPGTAVVLRAGYGQQLRTLGRYDITVHEPSFGQDRTPTVTVIASDGFARLMDNRWPADFGDKVRTYTDAALIMARKYGMGLAADVAPAIPHRKKRRRTRTGRRDAAGKPVYRTRTVRTRMVKNAGDSDAKMIKHLAGYSGFLHPKVRWVEAGSAQAKRLRADHAVVDAVDGRDVLTFRALDVRRQIRERGAFRLVYRRAGDARPGTLMTFDPRWDTDNVPIAVRVTGLVPGPPKEIVTVEAELVGPELLRELSALRRQAGRATGPLRRELLDKAQGLASDVAVTRVQRRKFRKQDRKRFRNAEAAILDVLEKESRPVRERIPGKKRKVQTMRREVMRSAIVATDGADLERLAKAWLQTRLELHITASAVCRDVPGLEALYPQQVHEVDGVSAEYDGVYQLMSVSHAWRDNSHSVNLSMERVAEAPSAMRGGGRARA